MRPDSKITAPPGKSRPWLNHGSSSAAISRRKKKSSNDAVIGLQALLDIEQEAREVASKSDLLYLLANGTRRMTKARQVFILETADQTRVVNISGFPSVDRSAPLVRAAEHVAGNFIKEDHFKNGDIFILSRQYNNNKEKLASHPYLDMMLLPLSTSEKSESSYGILLCSEQKFSEDDLVIAKRLAGTFAHALRILDKSPNLILRSIYDKMRDRRIAVLGIVLMLSTLGIPVSMTALAPVEVMPADAFIVAAPMDGVIEDVLIAPNEHVERGQPIVRLEATEKRNRLEIAEEEMLIAQARLRQARQRAFDDREARHELSIALANYDLKVAELAFSQEEFGRTTIKAARSGTAIFADRQELLGKPIVIGERVMKIADPNQITLALSLDVSDMIALSSEGKVKAYFDSDPLTARGATITSADYQARTMPDGTMAFRVLAELSGSAQAPPRLGARGTAQVYGETVPLGLYLFRRPLSTLRQWMGV
ncbi:MAG: biotin/lipoyl-binding protein [Alphaproteobacteria bacterium]